MDRECPSCSALNPASSKFCGTCGAGIAAACPSCGVPTKPEQRFCFECGAELTVRATPVAERRVCSVLFADLVGFTPLSEGLDSEQVRELLARYFEVARTVVSRYGGTIEKFIGDAVMAVWGTPVAVEGDAERAVRAALDLVLAVAEINGGAPSGLVLRAGIVTGEVAVTLGAVAEGMVAGDAVNTAARVQAAAAPGSVWVDTTTRRLAAAAIEFEDAGEHALKGKTESVQLWRARRVLSGLGGAQRVDGLEAPLTGRDAELRTIKELFHASAERRAPRLVLIAGTAGIGKSRLGWEFEKYVDGLVEVAYWHRGKCLSYGDGIAFWALAEIVRQRFAIAEDDPLDVAAGKLLDGLDIFVADPGERAYIGPRLGQLLGVAHPDDGESLLSRDELFAGWRLFFQRLAAVSPVVLLIEDAQHADPALLDFVDHLVDWARDAPIYVLMFARSELVERRPSWVAGHNRTLLTLDPLDRHSMRLLLDALVPGMSDDAVSTIAGQAQGNPLFALETVRALIDRDAVVPVEGVYRLVRDLGALSVPDSLHALLAARLDGLEPQLRSLVADAAVLGSSFPAEALAAVSGQPMATIEPALTDLVRRSVFDISADELSPQRGAYRFSQDMVRQVAYGTLSRHDRKARHLRVATYLRATFAADGDEVSGVVARHYLDAVEAVPQAADAADIRRRAVRSLIRAGEHAMRSGAPDRAGATWAEAAELIEDDELVDEAAGAPELWVRAAEVAGLVGAHVECATRAERARALSTRWGMRRDAARAQVLIGRSEGCSATRRRPA